MFPQFELPLDLIGKDSKDLLDMKGEKREYTTYLKKVDNTERHY